MDHSRVKHPLVVVEHRCKDFSKRLWNDMAIYACALELGRPFVNRAYLERTFFSPLHAFYARWLARLSRNGGHSVWALGNTYLLPPSSVATEKFAVAKPLYFFGWRFRNPIGFEKYRRELMAMFGPQRKLLSTIDAKLLPYAGKHLVGVYLKKKPFRFFENGKFLISEKRTNEIVQEYLTAHALRKEDMAIIETSDLEDDSMALHLLARCDVVLGPNLTLCNLAAWFGNVPHVVTSDQKIEWEYYKNRTHYFENKYATFAFGVHELQ